MKPPRLWAIVDRAAVERIDADEGFAGLARAGVDAFLLRERLSDDRALVELSRHVRAAVVPPARFVAHRRLDVALVAGADGLHLPGDGLSTGLVRRAHPRLLLGRSTHTLDEIRAARDAGADYVFYGPLFPTPSKSEPERTVGISSLADASKLGLPVIAIGGIDHRTAGAAFAAGAAGVAAIRACATLDSARRLAQAVMSATAGGGAGA